MKMLSKGKLGWFLAVTVLMVMLAAGMSAANITGEYPGHPSDWEGMTTNTIIKIDLDKPVAMNGALPDMGYTVKKAAFDGFDFVAADVPCDVEVSDDRMTIRLYPQSLLEQGSFYAYKLEWIAFGDGTEQESTQCYSTGSNPAQVLNTTVSEADMCDDSDASLIWGGWCKRCHLGYEPFFPCVQLP